MNFYWFSYHVHTHADRCEHRQEYSIAVTDGHNPNLNDTTAQIICLVSVGESGAHFSLFHVFLLTVMDADSVPHGNLEHYNS